MWCIELSLGLLNTQVLAIMSFALMGMLRLAEMPNCYWLWQKKQTAAEELTFLIRDKNNTKRPRQMSSTGTLTLSDGWWIDRKSVSERTNLQPKSTCRSRLKKHSYRKSERCENRPWLIFCEPVKKALWSCRSGCQWELGNCFFNKIKLPRPSKIKAAGLAACWFSAV